MMYDVSVGGSRNTSSTHCTDLHVTHIDASSRSRRSEKRWKEGYREAAILCILQSHSASKRAHRVILPQKQRTKSHLLKEDKFWQSEFICGWDLFTGNNFGFSFSSSQSLSSPFSPPFFCFCLMLCESSRRFCVARSGRWTLMMGAFTKVSAAFLH